MLKKLLHTTLSLLLSASIVFGYSGVGIYKMVCVAEQGKTVVSLTNVKDACQHEQEQQEEASCCHPKPKHHAAKKLSKPSCCDYSFSLKKLDDETLVQSSKTANAPHSSGVYVLYYPLAVSYAPFVEQICKANLIKGPPNHLRKQSYHSYIQVYQI